MVRSQIEAKWADPALRFQNLLSSPSCCRRLLVRVVSRLGLVTVVTAAVVVVLEVGLVPQRDLAPRLVLVDLAVAAAQLAEVSHCTRHFYRCHQTTCNCAVFVWTSL